MTEPRESQGPDRCRGSLKCRQFHDLKGTDLGGDSNCCCCNPCDGLRQDVQSLTAQKSWLYCCRCVPRLLYLRFVPDDPDDLCCRGQVVPMFHNRAAGTGGHGEPGEPLWSTYSGSLFGYTVTAKVGRVGGTSEGTGTSTEVTTTGTGTDALERCGWLITVQDSVGTLLASDFYLNGQAYGVDTGTGTATDVVSCLECPELIIAEGVPAMDRDTGTGSPRDRCIGTLVLERASKARLPFVERQEVRDFINNPGTGTDPADAGIIDLCDDCEAGEPDSLSSVSVDGATYLVDGSENGRVFFINGSRKLYWAGSQWSLVDIGPPVVELATGPSRDCPLGLWERTVAWTDTGTGTGTTSTEDCFCVAHADEPWLQPCGCCVEVCSRICVRGPRHTDDPTTPFEFRTFTWFEDWLSKTDENSLVSRGWSYANPVTGKTEYVYLEDDTVAVDGVNWARDHYSHSFGDPAYPYWSGTLSSQSAYVYWDTVSSSWHIIIGSNEVAQGPSDPECPYGIYVHSSPYTTDYTVSKAVYGGCYLHPRFEDTAAQEIHEPALIDMERGCGSDILVYMPKRGGSVSDSDCLQIRCGFCSCWKHWCAKCRCVPTELCAAFYDGPPPDVPGTGTDFGTFYNDLSLAWDEEERAWGTADDPVRLYLLENTKGQCVIQARTGSYSGMDVDDCPVWDCKNESEDRLYDPNSDLLTVLYQDHDANMFVLAHAMTPDCTSPPCRPGQPPTTCADECGSHPRKLYAEITMTWPGPGGEDPTPPPDPFVITVELTFYSWPTLDPESPGGIVFDCTYRGWIPAKTDDPDSCDGIQVSYDTQSLTFATGVPGGDVAIACSESCNPFYATGITYGQAILQALCRFKYIFDDPTYSWLDENTLVTYSVVITE